MTLGEKISRLRKEQHLTQEELAQLLNVSRQSVSKWESDLAYPETEKLVKMGKLFNCSMDYLLKEEVTQPNPPQAAAAPAFRLSFHIPEYQSKRTLWGLPLVHIGPKARGIIALGFMARGIVALGFMATGVLSFGLLSVGLFALGVLAIGFLSLGAFALGVFALGAVSAGLFAAGALAFGYYGALGDHATGMIAVGKTAASGSLYSHQGSAAACDLSLIDSLLSLHLPPWLHWLGEGFLFLLRMAGA